MKFRKVLVPVMSTVLSAGMLMSPATAFAASTNAASVGSTAGDISNTTKIGQDTTQSKSSEYQTVTADGTQSCNVYATVPSTMTVVIPKTIVLTGSTGSGSAAGSYTVKAYGDIAGNEIITVSPSAAVTLKQANKADVTATVSQEKTTWKIGDGKVTEANVNANNGEDTKTTGTVTATLTAGPWTGSFQFSISLDAETAN